ncbi:MAG: hypothetical protein ACOC4M_07345 [Promethearchaeia archaeon]
MQNQIKFVNDIDNVANNWVGGFSPKEKQIIEEYAKPPILHLFSGISEIGRIRVDISPKSNATIKQDVFDYIKYNFPKVNTILLDPIYCSEERQHFWKSRYAEGLSESDYSKLYIFPYDTRKTKKLWGYFQKISPVRIIIKSLNYYTIPNYHLLQGFNIYPGAFKPNRCLSIYQRDHGNIRTYTESIPLEHKVQFYNFLQTLEDWKGFRSILESITVPSDPVRGDNCPSHEAQRLYFLDKECNVYGYFDGDFFRLINPEVLERYGVEVKFNPPLNEYEIWKHNNLVHTERSLLISHVMFYGFPKRWELFHKYTYYRIKVLNLRKKIKRRRDNP